MSPEKWERMQQQGQKHRLNRATRVSTGDSGMALFIVLVLVLVLTVVITQMVFVTQVEKRISKNQVEKNRRNPRRWIKPPSRKN